MKRLSFVVATIFLIAPFAYSQNVGVGENAPASKLEIKGDTGVDLLNIKDQSNDSKLYIQNDGDVGIGTSSPSHRLHVMGNARFEKTAHAAGSNNYFLELYSPNTTDPANEISIRFHQGSQYWAQLRYRTGGFRFTEGSSDALTQINAGNAYLSGNVGIGAAISSYKLDVAGTARFTDQVTVPVTPTANAHAASKQYVDGLVGGVTETDPTWSGAANITGSIGRTGNVGIGTASPNGRLDIYTTASNGDGAVLAPAISLDNNFTIQTYIDQSLGGGWPNRVTYAGACCNNLALQPDAGTVSIGGTSGNYGANKFNVIGQSHFSGKIGVGTDAPQESIHVSNGNSSYALFGPNTSWNSYLYVGAGPDITAANKAQLISTNGNLHLDAGTGQNIYVGNYNSSNTFIATGGGNVGIGTTSPGAKLDVHGAIQANGNSTFVASDNSSTSYSVAALELRESAFGGAANLPPRLSFHWGGRVASQIAIEANGTIAIVNNPGTGYEKFRCLTVLSNGIRETSDVRLKNNIRPITGALNKVKEMQGVTYNWDQSLDRNEGLEEDMQYGLIAQELEKIIPELVSTDEEGWKAIEYSHLVPVLIEAMKEQELKMEAMEARHSNELACIQQEMEAYKSMAKDIEMLKKAINTPSYSASK